MADIWFVLVIVAFFGLCVGFVTVCERIIGPDPEGVDLSTGSEAIVDEPEEVTA